MRQRNVYPTDRIAYLWMHKTQSEARNQLGNLYFQVATIFSYGSHFPIAKHVTSKNGKQTAIEFTTRSYSKTTSKHLCLVRRAIPSGVTVFNVQNVNGYHSDNIKAYMLESKQTLEKAARSRKYATKLLDQALALRDECRAYAKFNGEKMPRFAFLPANKELTGLRERLKIVDAKQRKLDAKANKERAEREAIEKAKQLEKAQSAMSAWLAGGDIDTWSIRILPCELRIVDNEVETTLGASVPIDHAVRVLKAIRKVVASGQEFVTNGHTIPVGHHKVDRIEANGTLHAGCHHISLQAIERIAPELEAYNG